MNIMMLTEMITCFSSKMSFLMTFQLKSKQKKFRTEISMANLSICLLAQTDQTSKFNLSV